MTDQPVSDPREGRDSEVSSETPRKSPRGGLLRPRGGAGDGELDDELRRDRLLAGLTLIAGLGLLIALPFALQAGSEFFLPLTAALVIAIALVPVLEWLERHRLPPPAAALICVLLFLIAANVALASIVVPAWGWAQMLPERIDQIQRNISPLIDFYSNLQHFVNKLIRNVASAPPVPETSLSMAQPPRSLFDLFTTSAPSALLEMFFAILIIFFFLSGWTRLRRKAITSRSSFDGAMATARVIQDVVDDTSAYIGTITVINISLGLIVAGALGAIGMPTPLMWGGIVALLNYIPYLGPIFAAFLIAVGGLMTFTDLWWALLPAAVMVGAHLIEANVITPTIVGHRLTINPILILISLSFWGWVWGTPGALLAVPLLIIIQTVMEAAGSPDIAGFLFEHGTLVHDPHREENNLSSSSHYSG
ncbi:putative PurR-regulated permease PerM [Stakelama pacifica]|uniref:Putative PurR-regulated permease PerM n=1 Tax=Stakelama pacifica TaxID=517720 RepID=A0A4R6FXC5_9SPHN|nr:putative PurR-regulated permease PerM [Stakelama pacifica]GGO90103.1 AI-2E family transporter [Stakelama pacifica]